MQSRRCSLGTRTGMKESSSPWSWKAGWELGTCHSGALGGPHQGGRRKVSSGPSNCPANEKSLHLELRVLANGIVVYSSLPARPLPSADQPVCSAALCSPGGAGVRPVPPRPAALPNQTRFAGKGTGSFTFRSVALCILSPGI